MPKGLNVKIIISLRWASVENVYSLSLVALLAPLRYPSVVFCMNTDRLYPALFLSVGVLLLSYISERTGFKPVVNRCAEVRMMTI